MQPSNEILRFFAILFLFVCSTAWNPVVQGTSYEWLELEYDDELYVTAVAIVESFNPGTVNKILVSGQHLGSNTQWTQIWSSPIPGGVETIVPADTIRSHIPPVCPVLVKGKFLRIEFQPIYRGLGFTGIDAVCFSYLL
jgi:hypothetical protein